MIVVAVDWTAVGTSASIIAALAAFANLVVTLLRDRKSFVVRGERWAESRERGPMYVRVVVACESRRPVTIHRMGIVLRLKADGRRRTYDDGTAKPPLPKILNDGEAVVMSWMEEEIPEYRTDEAVIAEVFAVDAAGRRVSKAW